jgi:outer membrane protein assembly factor BamB
VAPGSTGELPDPLPPTAETLVGEVDARGNANVAWVRTLPGEQASGPEVARGPGDELIVQLLAERRPLGTKRFLDDTLLLRLDADTGALRWLKVVDPYAKLALDTQGNIILAWPTRLQKLDANGKLLWDKPRQAENTSEVVSIAIDSNDDLLLARVELDASPGKIGADPKGFVELEKLDAMGNPLWSNRFGDSSSYLEAVWITVDPANNPVLLAGGLNGPFDFGGGALEDEDVIAKYDSEGNHVFSKAFGGYGPVGYQASSPVQADADGNIFVKTESVGDIDVGLGTFFCGRQYVIKLDRAGEPLWNICAPAEALTLMPDGGFVVTSTLRRDAELGQQQCPVDDAAEGSEAALSRYDADGNWIASHCAADAGYQSAGAVAADASDMFFMTAAFTNQLTLPDGNVAEALDQNYTALVAKVALLAP